MTEPRAREAATPTPAPAAAGGSFEWVARLRDRRVQAVLLGALLLFALLAWWFFAGRESTDDARIEGHVTPIAARVGGTVIRVQVREQDPVAPRQVLFELDPRDFEVALDRARAELAEAEATAAAAETGVPIRETTTQSELDGARASAAAAEEGVALAQRSVVVAQAELARAESRVREAVARHEQARQDLERLAVLVARDEVSRQEYDAAVAAEAATAASLDASRADAAVATETIGIAGNRLEQARGAAIRARAERAAAATAPQRLAVTRAEADSARARLARVRAAVERARLDLEYTVVRAPTAGVVSRKRVEPGQIVQPGQPVLALVNLDEVWVVANFKETQLEHVRVGQRARVAVDAYPGRALRGRVSSLGGATTSRFSLLPAENPSGNFVKVVQRVPVKIELDEPPDPSRPLRPGMSVVSTVFTRGPSAETGDDRAPAVAVAPAE